MTIQNTTLLSADALIKDTSSIEPNPAPASGIAYCWYPNCCKNDTTSGLGFTVALAAAFEN